MSPLFCIYRNGRVTSTESDWGTNTSNAINARPVQTTTELVWIVRAPFLTLILWIKPRFSKCVNEGYTEKSLTKIEAVCIDNCVKKFMDFNHHVTIQLRELQEPQTLIVLEQQAQELGRQAGL